MTERVAVWTGDGETYLGRGTYVGVVTVYPILMPDGSLRTLREAEHRPTDEEVAQTGGTLIEGIHDNPKIVLDSGQVVYGCQVWWRPLEAGEDGQ